jgi:hypothetical protein
MEETVNSFQYVHLDQVDPSFTMIDEGFYNLKLITAETREYDKTASGGKKGEFIKLGFAVQDHTKFTGRRVYPQPLFPSEFSFRVLRRIQDATGVQQNGDTNSWLAKLQAIGPVMKLKVTVVPDANFAGVPNPKTVKPDGSPSDRNDIDWKAGIQPGE